MRIFAKAFDRFQKKDLEIKREARAIYEQEIQNTEKQNLEHIRKKIDSLS